MEPWTQFYLWLHHQKLRWIPKNCQNISWFGKRWLLLHMAIFSIYIKFPGSIYHLSVIPFTCQVPSSFISKEQIFGPLNCKVQGLLAVRFGEVGFFEKSPGNLTIFRLMTPFVSVAVFEETRRSIKMRRNWTPRLARVHGSPTHICS